ncbi:DUF3562 domain-containing protein (plasmid) [Cupriavidus sp. KK10]|jgi:hypothetical protein|uniref:DUF3562 domain-containing protein n=1 Tax=Cupriavidus sp. KK10 TaxID=1478019 RepID=UPI001BA8ED39|nr:DUF3562 domain-containing protein [Cupriavidus sp. KK10]
MRTEDQDIMVARIAVDTGFPPEVVRESYLTAIAELSVDARVHFYLPLFAAKRTIARLRKLQFESVVPPDLDPDRDGITSRTHIAVADTIPNCPSATSLAPSATGGWMLDLGGAQWYQRL